MQCTFPASGFRNSGNGLLNALGQGTYSWSTSSVGSGSSKGGFFGAKLDTYMHPLREDGRSYALPVRCVQELTEHFISSEISIFDLVVSLSREYCGRWAYDRVAYKFKQSADKCIIVIPGLRRVCIGNFSLTFRMTWGRLLVKQIVVLLSCCFFMAACFLSDCFLLRMALLPRLGGS